MTEHDWGLAVLVRRAKSGPFEEVPIDEAHAPLGVAATRQWIAALREHGITSGPLFPRIDERLINSSPLPSGSPDGRISARQTERIVAAAAAEAGLKAVTRPTPGAAAIITQARLAGHGELEIGRDGGQADGSKSLRGYIEEADRRR